MARTHREWIELFNLWSKPPSETEEAIGVNAAKMISDAVREYEPRKKRSVGVHAGGSYRDNTNTRLGSDIDIATVGHESFYYELPPDGIPSAQILNFKEAEYGLVQFRKHVREALKAKFGSEGFQETNKTFGIHKSKRKLDADATVFCDHHLYTGKQKSNEDWIFGLGVETRPRDEPAKRVIDWHQQHYEESATRNDATKLRFRRITRILKCLRDDMKKTGNAAAKNAAEQVCSFLIECLVCNAPDDCFNLEEGSYYEDTKAVIRYLLTKTRTDEECKHFVEVSRLKSLFGSTQAWTREKTNDFLQQAWNHAGFQP